MDDLISRQAAIDVIKEFQHGAAKWRDEQEERSDIWHRADSAIASAIEIGLRVKKLPSAQPERRLDEWCTDCKEYDQEKHCCPRWNRVIRTTLQEVQPERKKGKWKDKEDPAYSGGGYTACSICGQRYAWGAYHEPQEFRHCPRCGHQMEVEEDE